MAESSLHLDDINIARVVFGERDRHLSRIERAFGIEILVKGTRLTLRGKAGGCAKACRLVSELESLAKAGYPLTDLDIDQAARILAKDSSIAISDVFLDRIVVGRRNRTISPKTMAQKAFVDAIRSSDVTFGWGPAGTGKTYLAMAMAVADLAADSVERIVLTRPAVEAGEKLGFLPGNLAEKVNPYLRPLYDALHDMMDIDRAKRLVENGTIEVAPLAYMRGRTLSRAFVILDEAQNTTSDQMKMFLTRLGFDSKAAVTGDVTQTDLPPGQLSGLIEAISILSGVKGVSCVEFTSDDVVRHPVVARILRAYDRSGGGASGK